MSEVILSDLMSQHERFVGLLASWLGSRADAEDVLHDAYLRVRDKLDTVRDDERVVAWFERVLRNAAVDLIRHREAGRRAADAAAREVDDSVPFPDTAGEAICQCVADVIQTLAPSQAEVLRAVELEDRSPTEAAEVLGATPNNVRVRLHRARAALRERLVAVCGTCTEHGCLDCRCNARPPSSVPGA